MLRRILSAAALLAAAVLFSPAARADEALPPGTKVVKLEAQPASVTLKGPFDYVQLLLVGQLDSGDRIDVTRMATREVNNFVKLSPTGQVRPVADGAGALKFALGGQSVTVPVKVSGQKEPPQVSFVRDVMPVLSKAGCNAGTCHGAAKGKNGFKLSLRGYDPEFDHQALTDELEGRRFNRAAPERSLMLLKPAGEAPHVGGMLFKAGDPYYEIIKAWIAAGVKLDRESPRVTSLEVTPRATVVPLPGMKQQMAVIATYSDGSKRDVSAEAFVESSNNEVATVDKQGLVTAVRRGEATMLARYEGAYAASGLIIMGDRSGFTWKDVPAYNYIDELVYEKLKSIRVLPSELCSDEDFVRRVALDLTGLPPTPEAVKAFLADVRPTKVKRDELIDRLVGSHDYVEHWTNKWADLLQVNRKFLGERGAAALREYIYESVEDNVPYDRFVYRVLTASGSTLDNPPAAYYKVLRTPDAAMENTTQLFLAVRFNCNKCHDHPFERWTQDQYYHLAAYFAQVQRTEDPKFKGQKVASNGEVDGAKPLVEDIADINSGEVHHERTGKVTPPQFPYTYPGMPAAGKSRREQVAKWVTSPDNPYFAKSYVNRLWSYLLGVGLIEPVDDIRAGNPPTNPKLLDRLTQDFIDSGFNTRHLVRTICKSRVYQLSLGTNRWNVDDEINYSHALARRLPAEVLYDAIHRVTGSPSRLPGLPPGARAAELLDSSVPIPGGFLELFGKPPRESACECERSGGMMLGPVLTLINGPVLGEALKDPNNRLAKLAASQPDDAKLIEEIYLAVLGRRPTKTEVETCLKTFRESAKEYDELAAEYGKLESALKAYEATLPARQAAWEKQFKNVVPWTNLDVTEAKSKLGAALTKRPDGSVLASGKNGGPEVYTVTATAKGLLPAGTAPAPRPEKRNWLGVAPPAPRGPGITAVRLEMLTDDSLPGRGPGRASDGNFVLNEFKLTVGPANDPKAAKPVAFGRALADFSQGNFEVAKAIDGKAGPNSGWAIAPQFGRPHVAVFELKEPLYVAEGAVLTFTMEQTYTSKQHTLGRFRLSATTAKPPIMLSNLPDHLTRVLAVEPAKRTAEQKAEATGYFRGQDAELIRLTQAVNEFGKPADKRVLGAQDVTWALINSPAFLFNH
ncbi:MAG TPA: DUF1549 domain-containing protein [Gemmataceae bacterium]|nr:DUF1549 domain-containing protein [Gemmataceae bacterium]